MVTTLNMVVGLVLVAGMYLPQTLVLVEVLFLQQEVEEVVAVLKLLK